MVFTKIAIAGGSGSLGRTVVKALLDAKFDVTILSRSPYPDHDLLPGTKFQCVDYTSIDSLVEALEDQDALVNTLAYGRIPEEVHIRLIQAAQKADLKRFIPSEFGSDTTNEFVAKHPILGGKAAITKRLQEICSQQPEDNSTLTWTAVINGPFLDWGLENKFLMNLQGPSTPIYNGGNGLWSTTTLAGTGRAVAGILMHPSETKNRYVFVAEAELSQNILLDMSGMKDQITLENMKSKDLEAAAYEAIQRNPPDHQMFAVNLIRQVIFSEEYGNRFEKLDNELLGVNMLSEAEIIELVKRYSG
ncbi:oxidoreductase CipA [Penicillium angulare]|uniref:Oxidoreductase CipA n=1 Tax=Penicillium angulare TaxID=116970 RepID=A0A9W9EUR8_9EURO|nr:oxidoreductase CipA [Penicillium angulare]